MTVRDPINRRELFVKLGLLFDGAVGVLLGVPIVRFLLSPVDRGRQGKYDSWLSLGLLEQYPAGQTRLATYRNPVVTPTDGETANIACWVRRIDTDRFQVFAINCAHLGCPVRWFPQSDCSCAHVMAARTTPMALARLDRRSADCSSMPTRSKAASC